MFSAPRRRSGCAQLVKPGCFQPQRNKFFVPFLSKFLKQRPNTIQNLVFGASNAFQLFRRFGFLRCSFHGEGRFEFVTVQLLRA
ncbi:hypothetical protein NtRootA4_32270 [Arthrobacter sp. NtRootA4]|uniref:hypothetical protein n=1 Tax=Paenarthrobacter nicotinovorans TaxID=29320 RepID=UPI001669D022|nr:hypothetical protein [Paenarthrobacter nicotinovorans]BCW12166.1 hypothetical protein NtRootA2_34480 [Arthrobacter sp. NtRootA2]BCW16248.1 hypothetical protein NtRootA4_32270 [Arthrobacter sp. NtRootA4]BCW24580.1 hypothetical protein NtRootC7_34470 [Arthrobacter sp. NtRootC7]BCW28851.1 hypothetical protein NtRootC45_34510 [Arthrobacter sp. NtRootC45]BCW33121.1 hypothetical protein NtRootD5_34520 [Arthrobacter sp. NtRootD5]